MDFQGSRHPEIQYQDYWSMAGGASRDALLVAAFREDYSSPEIVV